jgi:conjugal transfer pilus assembly protein TraB
MAPLKLKFWDGLDPKRKQWALLALLLGAGFTILWAIFALTEKPKPSLAQSAGLPGQQRVTNVGVMAPGQQVNPLDSWLGGAGKDVAQLKQDRDAMIKEKDDQRPLRHPPPSSTVAAKINTATPRANRAAPAAVPRAVLPSTAAGEPSTTAPARSAAGAGFRRATAGLVDTPAVRLMRASLRDPRQTAPTIPAPTSAAVPAPAAARQRNAGQTLDNYLPISFTRAVLLGGLDADRRPSAINPHPVLLRLDDNALPNRFRAQCAKRVIGAICAHQLRTCLHPRAARLRAP